MKMKIAQGLLDEINAVFRAGTVLNLRISPKVTKRRKERKWWQRWVQNIELCCGYSVALVDDRGREIIDFGTYQGYDTLTIQGLKIELENGDVKMEIPT